ncbi:bifunctional allantoicase/(S)-ureidoglycine aminohydrolase [Maritimibacter dapengensis]|uniref:(S)-ureidoglycine aminohydrolase n=1 Tax=Maritimibacter dapengensis TaxID=2836868 RepID=A0ABS6T174_9RHOB|nr:bifunctional allantoicase/(S)-ureidoglycine aminohydrolase [Maritimibacter dapengensis]MBV7378988.1 (S)-ureidoglycine aminohydrolase [Maritimibacter dapengensis]
MTTYTYATPPGGLPPQSQLLSGRAVFTEAYAVIPRGTMTDIVLIALPFWGNTKTWVLSRPMTGFSESFSHYVMEVAPGGGSGQPETNPDAESVLFVTKGELWLNLDGDIHRMGPGGYAFLAPGADWTIENQGDTPAFFHWIRKRYDKVEGIDCPASFVTNERDHPPHPMPNTNDAWRTTRFVDPLDTAHDMHVTIVALEPGASIPFLETHVMEHGLYVLQGKGVYRLNKDWVEVEAGDYMWLRAFCPQACYAGGDEPFRYLLYKDVNRHMPLNL